MATVVPRHAISRQDLPDREPSLSEHTRQLLDRIHKAPFALENAMSTALVDAYERAAVDPTATWLESWESWVAAMQCGAAVFAAATTTEPSVQCLIHHEMRTVPAFANPESFVDAGHWTTTFYLAVICRNAERITALCNVPTEKLRESGAVYDEFNYAWIEALKSFWLGRPDFAERLVEAARGTDIGATSVVGQDHLSQIVWPPMDLLRWRATGEHEEFNRSLGEALGAHKAYWTADQGRADSCYGWVALAPLAMACLAQDADFPIDVESEYMPKHLLEGTWAGEFPT
ncbi:immunity 49 family protein [Streptomyces yangpuensis]|uniref:immunity 49 family protein n=1 Tax=Streptomyces yangpuensis TaxID=1648182 RepID=UPI00381DC7D3